MEEDEMDEVKEHLYKVLVIGEYGVGKDILSLLLLIGILDTLTQSHLISCRQGENQILVETYGTSVLFSVSMAITVSINLIEC
jgi:archaellum biogenesis ATPase FlaH